MGEGVDLDTAFGGEAAKVREGRPMEATGERSEGESLATPEGVKQPGR